MFVQIQLLEGLLESWSEYENNVQCLKMWFETQEKRLKQQHRIGDQASVQNAMKDCQVTCLEWRTSTLHNLMVYAKQICKS